MQITVVNCLSICRHAAFLPLLCGCEWHAKCCLGTSGCNCAWHIIKGNNMQQEQQLRDEAAFFWHLHHIWGKKEAWQSWGWAGACSVGSASRSASYRPSLAWSTFGNWSIYWSFALNHCSKYPRWPSCLNYLCDFEQGADFLCQSVK